MYGKWVKRKKNLLHVTGSGPGICGDRYPWKWEWKGKKKRPKDSGIGDGVGLHCGRDHGTQALPQEESNQLSNAALVSCVCVCVLHPHTGVGSQINRHLKKVYSMKDTPKRSKRGETDYLVKKNMTKRLIPSPHCQFNVRVDWRLFSDIISTPEAARGYNPSKKERNKDPTWERGSRPSNRNGNPNMTAVRE